MRLGAELTRAVERSGRTLADPLALTTDFGPGIGTRLQPVAHGLERLARDPAMQLELSVAVGRLLRAPGFPPALAPYLAAAEERRALQYYDDLPQFLSDVHRYGCAPMALHAGPLRDALARAGQVPQPLLLEG